MTIHPQVGALQMQGRGVCHGKEIVIMSTRLSFTTRTLRRSLIGTLAVLAMVPVLYFSACSSGDDGGGAPPPSNSNPPPSTGAANQFAYVISANSEIQALMASAASSRSPR